MAAGTAPSCWQRGAVSPLGSCVGGSLVEQEQMARRAAARALSRVSAAGRAVRQVPGSGWL